MQALAEALTLSRQASITDDAFFDAHGRIETANPAFGRATGWSALEAAALTAAMWPLPPRTKVMASPPSRRVLAYAVCRGTMW